MKSLQKINSESWKTELNDREFVIAVMKMLNEIQENSKRQFNEIRKKINEQTKYFIVGNCSTCGKCGSAPTRKNQWGVRLAGRTHVHG